MLSIVADSNKEYDSKVYPFQYQLEWMKRVHVSSNMNTNERMHSKGRLLGVLDGIRDGNLDG